jgi:hypothetical protein
MTVYGPRCNVHPERTGATRSLDNLRLIVIHTSEGSEGPTSAENLCSFMTLPGDRVVPGSNPPRMFGASYHYVTDTDRVLPAAPDNIVSYSAAGANHDGVHICIPGKANQTRVQWLDPTSSAYIARCAQVMRDVAERYDIPLERLTPAQVVDGGRGYCDHHAINLAYGQTDHTDVGPNFPWDVLADQIALEERVPLKLFNVKPSALNAGPLFASGDGVTAVWVSGEQWAALGNPPATELLERPKCRQWTLVGDCPDGFRGIWGQDALA